MTTTAKILLRIVSHAVAEVPLLVVAALQISHGWVPTSDDAVIAWRTWSVFSGPVPLTGQFSQITAGGGHAAFDLGPLQYFLLALPERIDPLHGILWGGALLAAGLAALAIESMWSACGVAAGAVTALGLAVMAETLVQSTVNLAWNPSTGVYALVATMAAAVAIGLGRSKWLPVAVGTGSLAAQCHLAFAAPVAAAIAAGLAIDVVRRRRLPLVALAVAAGVALACWIAPTVQQLTGHPGNWSVIAGSLSRHGRAVGFSVGLRAIGAATHVPPSWWVHWPGLGTVGGFARFMPRLYDSSVAWGVVALVLCTAVGVGAALAHRRGLAVVSAVTVVTALAVAWTIGSVPVSQQFYLDYYLYFPLWPVGMAMVAVVLAGAGLLVAAGLRRLLGDRLAQDAARLRPVAPLAGAGALAAIGALLLALDVPMGSSSLFLMGWSPLQESRAAVALALRVLERHEGADPRPFQVFASVHFGYYETNVTDTVAYLLAVRGYPARVAGAADQPLGAAYRSSPGMATLYVDHRLDGAVVAVWRKAGSGG